MLELSGFARDITLIARGTSHVAFADYCSFVNAMFSKKCVKMRTNIIGRRISLGETEKLVKVDIFLNFRMLTLFSVSTALGKKFI